MFASSPRLAIQAGKKDLMSNDMLIADEKYSQRVMFDTNNEKHFKDVLNFFAHNDQRGDIDIV